MARGQHLVVLLDGHVAAELDRTRGGVARLTFSDTARAGMRTPLSLSLPATTGTLTGEKVEWFLQGLLPDNESARKMIARTHGADAGDTLSLLAAVGKDCAGSVQFCAAEDVEATLARGGELISVSDSDIEGRLARLKTDEEAGWTMPGEHWSLGGSQQKFALRLVGNRWFEAAGSEPTSHIVKPGIYRLKAQALIEHVSMRTAQRCGISAATTEYTSFKSKDALVVARFDRAPTADGSLSRRHQEDLCQALGVREKYQSEGGPGAREIIRLLRDVSATAAEARQNVARFVDGLIYNTVIAGPDAHARNYAVLLDGEQVTLAPLFDVASGLAYSGPTGSPRALSMSVGGIFDAARIDTEAWKRFAAENSLDEEALLGRITEIAATVPDAMSEVIAEVDDWDGARSELTARLIPAIREHAARFSS